MQDIVAQPRGARASSPRGPAVASDVSQARGTCGSDDRPAKPAGSLRRVCRAGCRGRTPDSRDDHAGHGSGRRLGCRARRPHSPFVAPGCRTPIDRFLGSFVSCAPLVSCIRVPGALEQAASGRGSGVTEGAYRRQGPRVPERRDAAPGGKMPRLRSSGAASPRDACPACRGAENRRRHI